MIIYIVLFVISLSLTYVIKNYAEKKSLVDIPNERSSHTIPTPRGGGVAMVIAWFIGLIYLFYLNKIDSSLFLALLSGIFVSVISFFDDVYDLSPKLRLFVQACVAILGLYFLGGFRGLNLFFFTIKSPIFNDIFAFLLIVWFINLYNFLDGIDGYAGSEAVFLGIAGFLIFGGPHFLVLISAVLGFLVWNWHKAKIFMGDVGSTLLGYNVAIFTIYYANQKPEYFWVWIILFELFWFDATVTLFRRKLNGEVLSKPHKKHAYQRLTQAGWEHDKVVLFGMGVNLILFCLVYFIDSLLISFLLSLILLYIVIRFIDKKKAFA